MKTTSMKRVGENILWKDNIKCEIWRPEDREKKTKAGQQVNYKTRVAGVL